jgi:hypothetical protein
LLLRQVVLVTTRDRLQIPPIQRFRELVYQLIRDQIAGVPNSTLALDATGSLQAV